MTSDSITTPSATTGAAHTIHQRMQENASDKSTRGPGKFAEFEKTMPFLPNRYSCGIVDRVTSLLGSHNPFASPVQEGKQSVWLLDTTAWRPPGNAHGTGIDAWKAQIIAAYFQKGSGADASSIVADIAEKLGIAKGDAAETRIAERLQPFVDTICPSKTVKVHLEDKKGTIQLGPSGRDGISTDIVDIYGGYGDGDALHGNAGITGVTPLCVSFAEPTGWAVISDIDDTIKKTLTSTPTGILQTTFAEEPEVIPGMPELYSYLKKELDNPPFWYLSASPYNLYPFLKSFRDEHYPPGAIYLREASWMNLAGLLTNLTQGTEAYKTDRMKTIYDTFPGRQFVCIGDSTQTDPESYGDMYRNHPDWIGAIYIRKVMGVAEMDEGEKNSDERFEKAFKGVPKEVWHVFEDPSELYDRVAKLIAK